MCFPTFTGFSAGHLSHFKDDITVVMIQAYNDWHIDEWDGAYPGRFIPLAIIPTWDPELAVAEIQRVAAKGCRAVTMPELPHLEGLPSYHDMDHWGPVLPGAVRHRPGDVLPHRAGLRRDQAARPTHRSTTSSSSPARCRRIAAQDLLWGPAMRNYPDLKIAFSEGGIGWIPFYLDRCDRHYTNQQWLRRDFGGRLPSEVFREHSLACYVTDPDVAEAAPRHRHRHHRLGVRLPALRLALARRPRVRPRRAGPRRRRRRRHRQDHLAERVPLLRLGPVRGRPARAGDRRRAAGAGHRRRRVDPLAQGVGGALRRAAGELTMATWRVQQ